MGLLALVRHGQASFFAEDYDRLTDTGLAQARALGDYWAARGVHWDRVYVGPLRRHAQTEAAVAERYRAAGIDWPEAIPLAALDEHHALTVVRKVAGEAAHVPDRDELDDEARRALLRRYFRRYVDVVHRWAAGELDVPEAESFAAFRERAGAALQALTADAGAGIRVAAFSSGGLMSMIVGLLLATPVDRVIELSLQVRNCAVTEVRFDATRRTLASFNSTPHLDDPALLTRV